MHNPIVIVGAGPVGQLMALSLSRAGLSPILIGPPPKKCPHMVFALHPSHIHFLNTHNITPPTKAVTTMALHTPHDEYYLTPEHSQHDSLCHIIKYDQLLHHITKQLRAQNTPWYKTTASNYHNGTITIQNQTITPDTFIASDGTNSWLRKHTNITTKTFPYQQHAHTAILTHTHQHHDAYQQFDKHGTLSILPLPNPHQSALIWSCALPLHNTIINQGLKATLKSHHHQSFTTINIKDHHHIPLQATLAQQYVEDNIFLIGNALHTIHPLAGIGFNLALGDIITLTDILYQQKPAIHYQNKRTSAHTKAHWITHTLAQTREYTENFPSMHKLLTQRSIQQEIHRQVEQICTS